MGYGYSAQNHNKDHSARAMGIALPISTKKTIEICNVLRYSKLDTAKKFLKGVVEGTQAVSYRRFNKDIGHKKGVGPARYPKKTASALIQLLESAESNAQFKGLGTADLVISHIIANKASRPWHFGRQRRTKMKRTHVEIVVEEKKASKKNAKEAEKQNVKTETKTQKQEQKAASKESKK